MYDHEPDAVGTVAGASNAVSTGVGAACIKSVSGTAVKSSFEIFFRVVLINT